MNIIIESLTHVFIDGKPSGGVVDVLANNKDDIRAPLLDALIAWENERFKNHAKEVGDAVAAKETAERAAVAAEAKRLELLAIVDKADPDAIAAELEKQRMTEAEVRRAELTKQRDALQAELDALNAEKVEKAAKQP